VLLNCIKILIPSRCMHLCHYTGTILLTTRHMSAVGTYLQVRETTIKFANSTRYKCYIPLCRIPLWSPSKYTVRLLRFRTGIIKSICLKEMILLLFSFRHISLLTIHTDLHGHKASRCLCRSRPFQWCLMYSSRFSGCTKSSQRDAPSSGISLLGTKSNEQVLIWRIRRLVEHSHFSLIHKQMYVEN